MSSTDGKLLLIESSGGNDIRYAINILKECGYKVTEFPCGFIPQKIQEPAEITFKKAASRTWQDIYSKDE